MVEKVDGLMEPPGVVSLHKIHQLRLVDGHDVPADGRLDLINRNDVGTLLALSGEKYLFII